MKKMTALILTSVLVLALAACVNDKGQDYLNATVLEITDTEINNVMIQRKSRVVGFLFLLKFVPEKLVFSAKNKRKTGVFLAKLQIM